jgi:hypothetical protein
MALVGMALVGVALVGVEDVTQETGEPRQSSRASRSGRCAGAGWGVVIGNIATIAWPAELESQPLGGHAADHELLEVDGAMVEIAEGGEVSQLVPAAAALVLDVV